MSEPMTRVQKTKLSEQPKPPFPFYPSIYREENLTHPMAGKIQTLLKIEVRKLDSSILYSAGVYSVLTMCHTLFCTPGIQQGTKWTKSLLSWSWDRT